MPFAPLYGPRSARLSSLSGAFRDSGVFPKYGATIRKETAPMMKKVSSALLALLLLLSLTLTGTFAWSDFTQVRL